MASSIYVNAKKRGRPASTGTGVVVGVRMLPDQLAALDAWLARQDPQPSRPEAIRHFLMKGLDRAQAKEGSSPIPDEVTGEDRT